MLLTDLSHNVRQYLLITANYWAFTLTDGALRMMVILFFHQQGYSPLEIASLFVFYEFFGVVTNLLGGWLGAKFGLNRTMNVGLFLQLVALLMLALPTPALTVIWVMAAQALSGVAKDLNKMSAKSAIKLLVPEEQQDALYRWIATLTGSKNTLKGAGFFLGGALLFQFGFQASILIMTFSLMFVWLVSLFYLKRDLGKASKKVKFKQLFSKSKAINRLALARLFLFASRDVWFVIALPVFLARQLDWSHSQVGSLLACWIIFYGIVQTQAPKFTRIKSKSYRTVATGWALALSAIPAAIAFTQYSNFQPINLLILGLFVFGFVFAVNSALHSFLIVNFSDADAVSTDVGFYYMANAASRLLGTLLSGWVFQEHGLTACLLVSSAFLSVATLISATLPETQCSNLSPRSNSQR